MIEPCKSFESESERNINLINNVYSVKGKMDTQVTLEMIYDEVKRINERLRLIEDIIEEAVTKGLPEVTLSKEKMKEIEHSIQEMKKGSYVTL